MAAGDHVHCLGVLRFVLGEAFDRKVCVEIHRGVEDKDGAACWSQVEVVDLDWKELKKAAGAEDFKALLRAIAKVDAAAAAKCPALKKSVRKAYDDRRTDRGSGGPSSL